MFFGYRIIVISAIIQAMYLGSLFSFGVFFPEIERAFGWSRASIAGASAFATLVGGVAGIGMGRINDRLGPRFLLACAGTIFGIAYVSLYWLETIWHLYFGFGLLMGVGLSAHDIATLSTVARWFVKGRGAMTGVVKAGAGVGQLAVPLVVSLLIANFGWRGAALILGFGAMAVLVIASRFIWRDPAQLSLAPLGASPSDPSDVESGLRLGQALATQRFWILALCKFADFFCLGTIIVHIVPHAMDLGLSSMLAAKSLATIGGASIVGRLLFGSSFDRLGARWSLTLCFVLLAVSLIWLQGVASGWALFSFSVVYGFAHGGFFTLVSPSVAEYFGTRAHGAIFGAIFLSGALGGTFGPTVVGWLFDTSGTYQKAFELLTAASVVGAFLAWRLPSISTAAHPAKM